MAVTTWFPHQKRPSSGAFVVKDLHAIAAAGNQVRVVHLDADHRGSPQRFQYEGIAGLRIAFQPLNPLSAVSASRHLRSSVGDADVIHSMAMSTLLPTALARPQVPWVHTEHWSGLTNPDSLTPLLRQARKVIFRLEKLPDIVTTVCPYLSQPIRQYRHRPTVEVPCVVEPVPDLTPRKLPAPEPWRLISVGGLVERKDPIFALQVVEELRRRGRRAELTWVGQGPLEEAARDYATNHGLPLRLTGPLPYTGEGGVSAELQAADLFIGPTHGDNFFVSCAEAILNGRPVVVGTAGGHPEYMRDFVGRAIATHDATAYADAMTELLTATPDNTPSAETIAASIGAAFSSQTVGESYRKVYEAAVAGDPALLERLPSWRGW